MRARLRRLLIGAALAGPAPGCAGDFERVPVDGSQASDAALTDDAGRETDGAVDARDSDPAPLDAGGAVCDPSHVYGPAGPCTAAEDDACRADATRLANGRYGHSRCIHVLGTPQCSQGEFCDAVGCRCTERRFCAEQFVCVSDTLDGPTWCQPSCVP